MLFVKGNRIKAAACFLIQILTGALWFIWDFFSCHSMVLPPDHFSHICSDCWLLAPGSSYCSHQNPGNDDMYFPPCLYQLTCCTSLLKSSHESIFISRTSLSPLIVTYCILQGLNFLLFTHFQVCILKSLLSLVAQVLQVGERSREKV